MGSETARSFVVRLGHMPCGLIDPPEAYGLPPNDALQQTSMLRKCASPRLLQCSQLNAKR